MSKKVKNWLFGRDSKSSSNKEAEAIASLKKRLNRLEVQGKNLQTKANEQKIMAKKMLKQGNKSGAAQALKRSNLYMQKYNQIQNVSLNLTTQIETISEAKETAETVSALKIAKTVVDESLNAVSAEDVERTMLELDDQREQVAMMSESLADTTGLEMDLDEDFGEIDDQLAALELEIQSEAHGDLPEAGTGGTVAESPATTEETGENTADLEDELEKLQKELEGK